MISTPKNKIRGAARKAADALKGQDEVIKQQVNMSLNRANVQRLQDLLPRREFSATVDALIAALIEELEQEQ